ncbi:hypothetical protein [Paraburkholderia bryophila]|uniref:Uncharacterized protein n=1 Tax=Paraburkholderia bryophila TaxID=420952 RepID=A0A7Z0BA78_9BURK|nr:hypothetical protein [Paraburkholderia bryophila]NYH26058.1 hypothetical protein [Paraburkholderia bryophila]
MEHRAGKRRAVGHHKPLQQISGMAGQELPRRNLEKQDEERRTAGRYRLQEAADALEQHTGTSAKDWVVKLEQAVLNDHLLVYRRGEQARYRPKTVRAYSDEAYWDDLNMWLKTNEPRVKFQFAEPATTATSSQPVAAPGTANGPASALSTGHVNWTEEAHTLKQIQEQADLWALRQPARLFGDGFSEEMQKQTTLSRYLDFDTWSPEAAAMLVCGLQAPIIDGQLCTEIPEKGAMGLDNSLIIGNQDPFHEAKRVLGIWRSQENPPPKVRPLDFIRWCQVRGFDTAWLRSIEEDALNSERKDMKAAGRPEFLEHGATPEAHELLNEPGDFTLYWLNRKIEEDPSFAEQAMVALQRRNEQRPKVLHDTTTLASAASALVNEWLVNRELPCYMRGRPVDDFAALTLEPGSCSLSDTMDILEDSIRLRRDDVVRLLEREGMSVPHFLRCENPPEGPAKHPATVIVAPLAGDVTELPALEAGNGAAAIAAPLRVTSHTLKGRRDNLLTPVIQQVVTATGSYNSNIVFPALREIAIREDVPFNGMADDGALLWTDASGSKKKLNKKALGERLRTMRTRGKAG